MQAALSYEWVRLRTVRLPWWLAAFSIVGTGLAAWAYSAIARGVLRGGAHVDGVEAVVFVVCKPSFAPVVAGILGVFAVGSDYRFGTLRTTLLVTPRRHVALAAKVGVSAAVGGALATIGVAVAWIVGTLALRPELALPAPAADVAVVVIAEVALAAGWAVFGVAVAVLVRSQIFALAVLLAVPYALESVVRSLALTSGHHWLATLAGYLPFAAGSAMTHISGASGGTLLDTATAGLDPLAGAVIFFGTVGALMGAAALRFPRQDVA